jgi:coenzyme F420 biosynthesis associated uncharacterized protein
MGSSPEVSGRRRADPRHGGGPSRAALWRAGFLAGAVIGAAVTALGRRAEAEARAGLVDWAAVERIAAGRLRRAPGRLEPAEVAAAAPAYEAAMRRVVPALEAALGTRLPGVGERVAVVDRAGWVHANRATFEALFGRLEGELLDQLVPPGAGLAKASLALANRWFTTRQLGFLLGFMGQRVLGQYDLALVSAEATPGQLLFVEENVRQAALTLGVPLDPFRTWIALHETTHAFEFEAHAWLRPYLAERLERQLAGFSRSTADLGRDAAQALRRALRGGDGHWLERLMSDEQRRLFRETQTVMSLLEGFSDHVMDRVGRQLVPGAATISARFHARRAMRTPMERAILRITGLDLKLEQYTRGERFVAAVERAAGAAGLRRLWAGPESLPREGELEDPARWLRRVLGEGRA